MLNSGVSKKEVREIILEMSQDYNRSQSEVINMLLSFYDPLDLSDPGDEIC